MNRARPDKAISRIVDKPKTDSKRGGNGSNDPGANRVAARNSSPADDILNSHGSAT